MYFFDFQETAVSVSHACKLLDRNMEKIFLNAKSRVRHFHFSVYMCVWSFLYKDSAKHFLVKYPLLHLSTLYHSYKK